MACNTTNARGQPCGAPVLRGDNRCWAHSERVERRRAEARRQGGLAVHGLAGQQRPEVRLREIADVLRLLEEAAADLLARKPSIARARALAAVATASLKPLEVGELEDRIRALERRANLEVA